MKIYSFEELKKYIDQTGSPEYLLFWGHKQSLEKTSKGCFSQWLPVKFTIDSVQYTSAEQFMMAEKARLFGDVESYRKY